MMCPACNDPDAAQFFAECGRPVIGVMKCDACSAVYGSCRLGDSYLVALPSFEEPGDDSIRDETARYFDLICVGSKGVERRHGWRNPETRLIAQVG